MKQRKRTSPIWKISKEEFQKLYDASFSINEILNYFGMQNKGGNFRTLKQRFIEDNIDSTKFIENKKTVPNGQKRKKIPLIQILVKNSSYNKSHLKKRLIFEKILLNICADCGQLPEWNGKPLMLQLEHKNGISNDNRIENLCLLCPNCHTQTATFAGRSIRHPKKDPNCQTPIIITCVEKKSKILIGRNGPRFGARKVIRPSREELQKLLWEIPTIQIAKRFNVSDSAVGKWAKSYGINKPPRGYWGFVPVA